MQSKMAQILRTIDDLPVAQGGLGVRLASDLALPAFLASAHGASSAMRKLLPKEIQDLDYDICLETENKWKEQFNNNLQPPPQ